MHIQARKIVLRELICAGLLPLLAGQLPVEGAQPAHPVVAGFERFGAQGEPAQAGRLLLGELNCISCHQPEASQAAHLLRKRAPVLDGVAGRVRRSYLRKMLTDPQAVKPGTTMPNLLASLAPREREQAVEALVHFLSTTGALKLERPQIKLVAEGWQLYNQVGCVGCHGSRNAAGKPERLVSSSVPLGDLPTKYSLASLTAFLDNPHAVRPSGRMPRLVQGDEARKLANFLLQGGTFPQPPANMTFAYYEGSWDRLPDFKPLTPVAQGRATGFDLDLAHRANNMAMRFQGYLHLEQDGDYRFHLTSDDGSKVFIDGKMVVENDGVHAPSTRDGMVHLGKGAHRLEVGVFNAGGGVELGVQIEGGGLGRQDITPLITLTETVEQQPAGPSVDREEHFRIEPELVTRGKVLFATLGCASCHQMTSGGQAISPENKAQALGQLKPEGGCLSDRPVKGAPWYDLSPAQRAALTAAIQKPAGPEKPRPAEVIAHTLTTFNCYACHERDKVGGIEQPLNSFFTTTQPEMGEEGRVPPTLTGVGAKLKSTYIKHILADGARDRPYMNTRMPRFAPENGEALVAALGTVDTIEPVAAVHFDESPAKVRSEARKMVGGQMLGCVKCHTFAGHKAEGVQGIDMLLMPQRLQHAWYRHYLLDPQKLRPGTRMPTAWPNGTTVLDDVLGGRADRQMEAIWVYLSSGNPALPVGVHQHYIPLIPGKEAILYRNFIQGAGPRAIGVGFPEKAHLAFDANDLRLAMVWQGEFIDAAHHWTDRGAGFEGPLGENVLPLANGVSLATLSKPDSPWPTASARKLPGYHFHGYTLSKDQRPTFRYEAAGVHVEDTPTAVDGKPAPSIRRTLAFRADRPLEGLTFRAAESEHIEDAGQGWFRIKGPSGDWKMKLEGAGKPRLRKIGGRTELLVPIPLEGGQARLVQEIVW